MPLPRTHRERTYSYGHEKYDQCGDKNSTVQIYGSAAVACDSSVGSKVGKETLEKGGSVVDAAISCLLCNSLLNAQSMGIGGGFFMLHYSKKDEKITVIDARETAPNDSTSDMFNNSSKTKGGLSIAVPGEIKGYWMAHKMFGNLKWNKLFQPAIEMCNNGFQLPASQAKYLETYKSEILGSDSLRETFVNKLNGEIYKVNNTIRRPKLAKTLEVISKEGESSFYNGRLSDIIIEEIMSNGGIINKEDLKSYECLVKEPITFKLKNNIELNTVPAPSCGILLNFILGILDGYDDYNEDSFAESNALFNHRFIEACKFGFGFRYLIGDDNFNDSTDIYNMLSDRNVINEYMEKINDNFIHPTSYYGSDDFVIDNGTAHTSLIAPNGDAVAITSSINLVFGSKVIGNKTNIIYNNQMDDFSQPDSECNSFGLPNYHINYIEPKKRPVSSMTPLIAIDSNKDVRLVCGSSGGTRIITSTALTTARNLIRGQDLLSSVDEARLHQQLRPDEVLYENHLDENVLNKLTNKGHNLINFGHGGSAVQAIERLCDGRLRAVGDVRKGGIPDGF